MYLKAEQTVIIMTGVNNVELTAEIQGSVVVLTVLASKNEMDYVLVLVGHLWGCVVE